jgi:hypothetical protein
MTIYQFNTRNFTILVEREYENDTDFSFDESGEIEHKCNSGELDAFAVKCGLYLNGKEIASDYLGGCIYESYLDFKDNLGNKNGYFGDMIKQTIKQGRKYLSEIPKLRK